MTNNTILRVIAADGSPRKAVARPVQEPIRVTTPLASEFACHMSRKLRGATQHTAKKMFETLFNAGIETIDGWSIDDLIRGRLNPETGERYLPSGEVAKVRPDCGTNDGRYYGSKPKAPITSLYQTGVIWQSGS